MYPEGCLGAWDGDQLCGYIFSHPWHYGKTVPLNTESYVIPTDADCLYIHDLAVDPNHRERKIGRILLNDLFNTAAQRGWQKYALVAVQGSEPFWSRWGFTAQRNFEYIPGVKATYMTCFGPPVWKPCSKSS
ncbi:MAG: hypothetical protein A2293_06555 [Elusimicrobia bacterium RIFOXYB2_FULL_49_7]|nr:MAG: hypothetical protein A2293_06555 [Elusimicrobia bacterium RIFOXYB2_FULL_49_7]